MQKADATPVSKYLHGSTSAEQSRLSLLNTVVNQSSLDEMRLVGGERILDVGSGLGQLTRMMARAAGPNSYVLGIERSTEQLAEAVRQADRDSEAHLVEFRRGEAAALPLREEEWGTFDVAHARFLLEHVPNPAAVVQAMARAVRPGGRIILEDDSHDIMRLTPEPPGFRRLWEAYMRTYDRLGNDPYIGHRLVSLLWHAGAAPFRNTWIFFGGCRGDGRFDALIENLLGIMNGAKEVLFTEELIDPTAFADAITALQKWSHLPDAAIWFAISWAEGRRIDEAAARETIQLREVS